MPGPWIGVAEALPSPLRDVLVFAPGYGGRIEIGSYSESGTWWDTQCNPIEPTHWMSLPQPPA